MVTEIKRVRRDEFVFVKERSKGEGDEEKKFVLVRRETERKGHTSW